MPNLQVKNIPEPTYAALRRRASSEGTTIRGLVMGLVERELSQPSTREWLDDLARNRPTVHLRQADVQDVIDAGRDEIEGRRPYTRE